MQYVDEEMSLDQMPDPNSGSPHSNGKPHHFPSRRANTDCPHQTQGLTSGLLALHKVTRLGLKMALRMISSSMQTLPLMNFC
jgi:hypothetical protein